MGHKPLSTNIKKSLTRKIQKEVKSYEGGSLSEHTVFLNSFTAREFLSYEHYHKKWGTPGRKRQSMLDAINRDGVSGNVKVLAEIRVDNLYTHQKLLQSLRYRWTNLYDYRKDIVNNDEDKFWIKMARSIQSRNNTTSVGLYNEWENKAGAILLAEFLKSLSREQANKCAITGEPMLLEIGTDIRPGSKCSPDRINSDIGYYPGNIQLTTWWVNNMKSDMSIDEFYNRIRITYNAISDK